MHGKSCLSNLLESIDIINNMLADGEDVDIFFMDFQKAFDSVPHYRLIIKLKSLGISQQMIEIVSDFLADRSYTVNVGDSKSKSHKITSGIPQGSVLGPILFLLYINDLPDDMKNAISLFADDVKMCARSSTFHTNQEDINKMAEWQNHWLLKFNTKDGKCKVLHIGKTNPRHTYYLEGTPLPVVEQEKDLGVLMTSTYVWTEHINNCIKKANSVTAWITRTIISRSPQVLLHLYKSLVRPHLEYCVQLWSPRARYGNWGTIMDIEGVQRKFTRLIDGLGLMTYRDRLQKLDLTTLLERRARGDLIETFKILSGISNYGKDMFKTSRSGLKLVIPEGKNTQLKADFLSSRVVSYWNRLPAKVKNSES